MSMQWAMLSAICILVVIVGYLWDRIDKLQKNIASLDRIVGILMVSHDKRHEPIPQSIVNSDGTSFDLKNKTDSLLLRELRILAVISFGRARFLVIETQVLAHEPFIKRTAIIAHLDRLINMGIISRPSKGHYTLGTHAGIYKELLTHEVIKRGMPDPILHSSVSDVSGTEPHQKGH